MTTSPHFQEALECFDQANAKDPNREKIDGQQQPHELIDARRLHDWVLKLRPDASEALRLAARCQHICRWQIPRSTFPDTRSGYLQWRKKLQCFHAETAGRILSSVGYDEPTIQRVQALNRKETGADDSEGQVLEDALCLVFLEFELESFGQRYEQQKIIRILKKTWAKMSPTAQQRALRLEFSDATREVLKRALGDEG